jgi:hypothetical protein
MGPCHSVAAVSPPVDAYRGELNGVRQSGWIVERKPNRRKMKAEGKWQAASLPFQGTQGNGYV